MEKLIELLNEYQKTIVKIEYYTWRYEDNSLWHDDENDLREGDNFMGDVAETYVISKKYKFIKWLVDNNKIDGRELRGKASEISEACLRVYQWREYEALLMLLSISDNPIQDLISLLK